MELNRLNIKYAFSLLKNVYKFRQTNEILFRNEKPYVYQ